MTRNDKFNIQRRIVWRNFWQRLSGVPDLAVKLLFAALYLAGMVWVWSKQEAVSAYAQSVEFMSPIMLAAMTHVVPAYLIVGGAVLAVLMVYPFGRKAAQDQLRSIGLVNRAEMVCLNTLLPFFSICIIVEIVINVVVAGESTDGKE